MTCTLSVLSSHEILLWQVGIFKSGSVLQSIIANANLFSVFSSYKLVHFGDRLLHTLSLFKNVWGKHSSVTGRSIPAGRGRCLYLGRKMVLTKERLYADTYIFSNFFICFLCFFKVLSNVSCGDSRVLCKTTE